MSIMSKVKNFAQKNVKVLGITAAVVAAAGLGALSLGKSFADSPVSTPDCTANSVIWCGAANPTALDTVYHKDGGDGHNTSASIQRIYAWFGIDSSDVDGMKTDSVNGYVTKTTGDVYANGVLVATDALTAGREEVGDACGTGTQTLESYGGTSFYTRKPSVSFCDQELSAMVVMKNGVFQFAILVSCGNPIKAVPVPPAPKPALVCSELNATLASTDLSNGDQSYSFEATATPTNGATISNYDFTFGDGATQTVSTSSTSASASHTYAPGTWSAKVTVNGSNDLQSSCTKSVTITPPAGTLICCNLALEPGTIGADGSEEFTLNATALASTQNATISSYTFNLGGSYGTKTVTTTGSTASTSYTYPAGADVTATVTVTGTVNGKSFTTPVSSGCSKEVQVPAQQASSIVCEDLAYSAGTADSQGNIPYTFTAAATPTNATISDYVFSFAPNSPQATNSATYSYAPGTNVSVNVKVNGTLANGSSTQVTSSNCAVEFTVPNTPTCTSVGGQTYPEGSSECETCTSPSGQTYQLGSSECNQTPTTPTTPTTPSTPLPNTGPGDVVGLFSGVSMSGAGLHRILGNRRARRAAIRR